MIATANETKLRQILREEGRRQDWLVDRLRARGIKADKWQVSRWVRGVHVPEELTREAIAEELGRDIADVWPEETR